MLFLRRAFINVASLNAASRSQLWRGPRAHSPQTEGKVCVFSHLWYSSRTFPENVHKHGGNVPLWDTIRNYERAPIYLSEGRPTLQSTFYINASGCDIPKNSRLYVTNAEGGFGANCQCISNAISTKRC